MSNRRSFNGKRPKTAGKGFALYGRPPMEMYSPREVALAAGVPEALVRAALGGSGSYVSHDEAVRVGKRLAQQTAAPAPPGPPGPMFDAVAGRGSGRHPLASLTVSSVVHAALAAIVVLAASVSAPPHAAALPARHDVDPTRLVFVATQGPGGGGGGGGREDNRRISSPLPAHVGPRPIEPPRAPAPTPVLQ